MVVEPIDGEVVRIAMSSRLTRRIRFEVCAYLAGDLLVDSGFAHVRGDFMRALGGRPVAAVLLTHHHEDHSGNCGVVARSRGCPVLLGDPHARWTEGLADLAPYRLAYWGRPAPYEPLAMPGLVEGADRALRAVPTPGHSATHRALLDERTGALFTGDLYVSPGAGAVMRHENPFESVASLRRLADLGPARLLTGHGLVVDDPVPALRAKADRIEAVAAKILALHDRGLPEGEVLARVFGRGLARDHLMALLTSGEFSRRKLVRACIAHRERTPPRGP